jgi:hypothetical protein
MASNWWARFTLWIYGVGLPCLALVVWRRIERKEPPPVSAALWFILAMLLYFAEAGACVLRLSQRAELLALVSGKDTFHGLRERTSHVTCAYRRSVFSPDMRGTEFEMLDSQESVALGPLSGPTPRGAFKFEMAGALSRPIGFRKLFFVPRTPSVEQLRGLRMDGVRYIVWDDELAVPNLVAAEYELVCRRNGFLLLKRRQTGFSANTAPERELLANG